MNTAIDKRKFIILFIAILIAAASMIVNNYTTKKDMPSSYGGKVLSAKREDTGSYILGNQEKKRSQINLEVKLYDGPDKGKVVKALQYFDDIVLIEPKAVEAGDRVLLRKDIASEQEKWDFIDYDRRIAMLIIAIIFVVLILLIGRGKGFWSLIALILSFIMVIGVLLPGILKGRNIYALTLYVSLYIIFVSLWLLNGISIKSTSAIAGNIGGLLVAGMLAFMCHKYLYMTGVVDEHSIYLSSSLEGKPLDLLGILWSGVLIGALGAVMDVSMTISSAVYEVSLQHKNPNFWTCWKSGMEVGKDVIGTMTNTLLLAYMEESKIIKLFL
ncbi:MAG: YibE/F family protein [Tissierellia bacterium]|nr:YibE/F family protein [Tissierellia bacterium]